MTYKLISYHKYMLEGMSMIEAILTVSMVGLMTLSASSAVGRYKRCGYEGLIVIGTQ